MEEYEKHTHSMVVSDVPDCPECLSKHIVELTAKLAEAERILGIPVGVVGGLGCGGNPVGPTGMEEHPEGCCCTTGPNGPLGATYEELLHKDNKMGLRIATNGCFDLFHKGHEYLLTTCFKLAEYGELLILIDTDESIKKLKGEQRPIDSLREREENIREAINSSDICIDDYHIQSFSNDYELLKAFQEFKPDIIVKGSDRPDVRTIIGSGEFPILIVPRLRDEEGIAYSTTRLIEGDE